MAITTTKAYHIVNKISPVVEESINIRFDDNLMGIQSRDKDNEPSPMQIANSTQKQQSQPQNEIKVEMPKDQKYLPSHQKEQIIGDASEGIRSRASFKEIINFLALISKVEPKEINKALKDENRIEATHEEVHHFEVNEVWGLVPNLKEIQ